MKTMDRNSLTIRPCSYLLFFELLVFALFLLSLFLMGRITTNDSDFMMFVLSQVCFYPFLGFIANSLFNRPSYVFHETGFSYATSPFMKDVKKYKTINWESVDRVVTWDLGSFGFWTFIFSGQRKFTFGWIIPEYFELLQFVYSKAKNADIDERTKEFQSEKVIKKLKKRRTFIDWGMVVAFLLLILSLHFEFGVNF